MSTNKVISVAQLLIDPENPRFPRIQDSQNGAIKAMVSNQQRKLVTLADDILSHGMSPSELLLVIPYEDTGKYIVLEGNRRVAALKVLENPDLARGAIDTAHFDKLQKLSKLYEQDPISGVSCIVFDTRDDASPWIEKRHTGENQGAGLVPWGAEEKERFRTRSGQQSRELQILDFLQNRGYIDQDTRERVPVSSLRRLISTPYVRAKLGIEVRDGQVRTRLTQDEVAKGLKKVVEDLATRAVRTGAIYHAQDRGNYIDSLALLTSPQCMYQLLC